MGQKVNPIGLRLGVNKTWKSKWYVDPREYADTLHEDLKLRKALLECPEVQEPRSPMSRSSVSPSVSPS